MVRISRRYAYWGNLTLILEMRELGAADHVRCGCLCVPVMCRHFLTRGQSFRPTVSTSETLSLKQELTIGDLCVRCAECSSNRHRISLRLYQVSDESDFSRMEGSMDPGIDFPLMCHQRGLERAQSSSEMNCRNAISGESIRASKRSNSGA